MAAIPFGITHTYLLSPAESVVCREDGILKKTIDVLDRLVIMSLGWAI